MTVKLLCINYHSHLTQANCIHSPHRNLKGFSTDTERINNINTVWKDTFLLVDWVKTGTLHVTETPVLMSHHP